MKSRLQLTRKLAHLATICLELEPAGNGNEQEESTGHLAIWRKRNDCQKL